MLFLTTVLTTVIVGAIFEGADILEEPLSVLKGVPFSAALLFILGTHEFGHYFASRVHKVSATLPFFIPAPPVPPFIGTFGAVIKMKSPITTRRALVDIGAAGPIAGFIAAIPVIVIGLKLSLVTEGPAEAGSLSLGTSLGFELLSYLTLGPIGEGAEVHIHSVAFAGWIGLLVTSLNLLPMGQLDGGHIVYAMVGERHRVVSLVMVALLALLGFFTWPGWLLWAVLVTFIGMRHPPVLDEQTRLGPARRGLCAAALLVFVLTFMWSPFYIVGQ